MNYEIGLYKHNAEAYEMVKAEFEKNDKTCIVHATGTGKSFIALQLMYDFIKENPDRQIVYLTPLNRIKEQVKHHIDTIEKQNLERGIEFHREYFDNVKFITYARVGNNVLNDLDYMSRDELSHIKADMMILDEFHHIGNGAENWKAGVQLIERANPNIKIFGMSATNVRSRGTDKEEDVAQTFFEGRVASEYPLEQAIADKVLPCPNYHAAYAFLVDECEELEEKVKNGTATNEEKEEYSRKIKNIKEEISKLGNQTVRDIVGNYIKPNGKYIYFCPSGSNIEELQANFLDILPTEMRGNVEFYQVHSSNYSQKENMMNVNNFYNNISLDGQSSSQKLRVMFAVDMYNEGVHVPDIDGVIMGRNTNSDIIYYQQLGRALAVKKKSDNDDAVIESPLVLDLQDNFSKILKLYFKVKNIEENATTNITEIDKDAEIETKYDGTYNPKDLLLQFGIDEQVVDIVSELSEIKQKVGYSLTKEQKIEEIYTYYDKIGKLPSQKDPTLRFSDNSGIMGQWISDNKSYILELAKTNEHAKKIARLRKWIKGLFLTDEQKVEEIYDYLKKNRKLPFTENTEIRFSDNSGVMGMWLSNHKTLILELAKTNEHAKKIAQLRRWIKGLLLTDEQKVEEIYVYFKKNRKLPTRIDTDARFSDNSALMELWIISHKSFILELAQTNEHAREIARAKGWIEGLLLAKEQKVEEIYAYFKKTEKLPSQRDTDIRFSDNSTVMGQWLHKNKDFILELAKTNEHARKIAQVIGWLEGLFLTNEQKVEEIYAYYKESGKLPPTEKTNIKFSDNSGIMGKWLSGHKTLILELAQTNEHAREIAQAKRWIEGLFLTKEQKIEEIYDYFIKNRKLPPIGNNDEIFSDGSGKMGQWVYDNKSFILELAQTNEHARKIAQAKKWIKGLFLTDEQKVEEIYDYLKKNRKLPFTENTEIRFSDNSGVMGMWLSNHKTLILELAKTNEHARKIAQAKKWIKGLFLTDEQKVEEIYAYFKENGKLPNTTGRDLRFSDDSGVMGTWITPHMDFILEFAKINEHAREIAQARKWIKLETAKAGVPNEQAFEEAKQQLAASKPSKNKEGVQNGKQL